MKIRFKFSLVPVAAAWEQGVREVMVSHSDHMNSHSLGSPTVVGSVDKAEGQIMLCISPTESASVGSLEDCD